MSITMIITLEVLDIPVNLDEVDDPDTLEKAENHIDLENLDDPDIMTGITRYKTQ